MIAYVTPELRHAANRTRSESDVRAEKSRMWRDAAEKWRLLAAEYEFSAARCDDPERRQRMLDGASGARAKAAEAEAKANGTAAPNVAEHGRA